jgi:PAS domain S-box-containing protein
MMEDEKKTKKQLIEELNELRQCVAELKGFEKEIEQTRKFTKAFMQNSIPVAIMTSKEGRFVDVSDAFLRFTGRQRDEVIGRTSIECGIIAAEQRGVFYDELNKKGRVEDLEMEVRTKDGALRYGLFNAVMMSLNNEKYLLAVSMDITERRQTEMFLQDIIVKNPMSIQIVDKEGYTIQVNAAHTKLFGAVPHADFSIFNDPQIQEQGLDKFFERAKKGEVVHLPDAYFNIHNFNSDYPDTPVWLRALIFPLYDSVGKPERFVLMHEDITSRKQAEAALRRSEDNFRRSLEESPLGVRIVTAEGETIYANRAILDINGCDTLEELKTTPVEMRYTPESFAEHQIRKEKRKRGDDAPSEYEIRIIRKDGEIRHLQVFRKEILWDGEKQFQVLYNDITSRKQAEEALRREKDFAESLIQTAQTIVLVLDTTGHIVRINPYMEEVSGRRLEEVQGKDWFSTFLPKSDRNRMKELFLKAINDIQTRGNINPIVTKDGREIDIEWYDKTLKNEEGTVIGLLSTGQDITDRKQAEEIIQRSEEKFAKAFHSSPILTAISTIEEGRFLDINGIFLQTLLFSREEVIGKTSLELGLFANPLQRQAIRKITEENGYAKNIEIQMVARNGQIINGLFSAEQLTVNNEKCWLTVMVDVTEQKQAEEMLKASLREKEILLNEIHHRVKNNMQVISSLLKLQASASGNPELTERLNESQSRIHAMALVHEKLYGSKDFTRIDLAGYVRTLSQELFQSHKINQWKIALVVQTDGEVYVDVNKAIPCGLILNELISNALKHAFPGGRQGDLQILLRESENTEIEIVVRDNGLGLPDNIDIHAPRSLGLDLVNGLVTKQLDGQIEVRRDKGTEFRIKFPL